MELELAQVAAGLPLAASFAVAGGINTLREGRRRAALNEALHELRRPLQVMSLSLPADHPRAAALDSSLVLAAAALERLDREINGTAAADGWQAVELGPLVEAAVERWQARAVLRGGSLEWRLRSIEPFVEGDGIQLAQAVDNMISNAIEHGGSKVRIEVGGGEGKAQISVLDSGAASRGSRRRSRADLGNRISGRHRHGHGLRVVERAARAHGGSFRLRRLERGAEARLELPLCRKERTG
jgi:signal transduction histidine kinase